MHHIGKYNSIKTKGMLKFSKTASSLKLLLCAVKGVTMKLLTVKNLHFHCHKLTRDMAVTRTSGKIIISPK